MASSINGRKAAEIFQGQALLYRHKFAFIHSMCLKWIVELEIPNIIHNHGHPITHSELVSILQVPQSKVDHVRRIMRHMAHNGFFEIVKIKDNNQEENKAYALTAASELLVEGSNLCLAPMVEFHSDPTLLGSFHQLKKWIYEEDLTLFEVTLGSHFYEFLNTNPDYNSSFNDAMASDSQMINLALKDFSLVFEGLESIVDVGGGAGTTAKLMCDTFPKLKCIVFDRPQVVDNLSGTNNLTYVGGDMFISIPKADAVLLKFILHNWTDKDCIRILEKCKDAISSDGKRGLVLWLHQLNTEIDVLKQQVAEVDILKQQVAEVDILKEQIAFLMRNAKGNQLDDLESPTDDVRRSSESSHVPQDPATSSRGTI